MKKHFVAFFAISVFALNACSGEPFEILSIDDHNVLFAKISVPNRKVAKDSPFLTRLYYGNSITNEETYVYFSTGFEYTFKLDLLKYHDEKVFHESLFETTLGAEFITDPTNFVETRTTFSFWKEYIMNSFFEIEVSLSDFEYEAGALFYLLILRNEELDIEYLPFSIYLYFSINANIVTFNKE